MGGKMKTLICLGDSLTEAADIPVGHGWPALVSNALDLEVINAGIGGDTTAGMLARLPVLLAAKTPAFVFFMGGTNDLWWGWEVNTVVGNLFSMVVQARHHGIAPIIGLPLPVNVAAAKAADFSPPLEGYDRFSQKLEALAEALIFHAAESEVAVVDLYRPFMEDGHKVRSTLYLPDGLHPNRTGHQIIAQELLTAFRQTYQLR
jgi:lysophospholipase L1-like esterase